MDVTIHPLSMADELYLSPPLAGDSLPVKKGTKRGAEVYSRTKIQGNRNPAKRKMRNMAQARYCFLGLKVLG